jgi:membrane complex biogenesis BtpA family protein
VLTRDHFARRFGSRAVFGMVHLRALPGAPLFAGSIDAVVEAAAADARSLADGGCDAIVFENFGDRPFFPIPGKDTIAAMTRVIADVARTVGCPFGVNVLRNDPLGALAIAAATGAAFIRVNVHTGAMLTDQGVIEGTAAATLRFRAANARDVAIFADHMVKHATPLGPVDDVQAAKDLRERGLADAIIISGRETGAPAEVEQLALLREAIDAPLLIGSGVTADNAIVYAAADGVIAGTSLKSDGRVDAPVDRVRVERVVSAFKRGGGR